MDKEAQIAEALQGAGSNIMDALKNAPDKVSEFWGGLSPAQKSTVLNSLAGAAAGGLGSGLLGGGVGDSAIAALLGGGGAAGLTMGYNSLFGNSKLPSEVGNGPGVVDRGLSAVGNPILGNPGTSIGGALGAYIAGKHGGLPFSDKKTVEGFERWANEAKGRTVPTKANLGLNKDIDAKKLLGKIRNAIGTGSTLDPEARTFKSLAKRILSGDFGSVLDPQLGTRGILEQATRGTGASRFMPNRAAWMALPAGLAAGAMADKYVQGEL
jgi:hypothetical protein